MSEWDLSMSVKVKDDKNRWRNKTVAFRLSPEEAADLDNRVKLFSKVHAVYTFFRGQFLQAPGKGFLNAAAGAGFLYYENLIRHLIQHFLYRKLVQRGNFAGYSLSE